MEKFIVTNEKVLDSERRRNKLKKCGYKLYDIFKGKERWVGIVFMTDDKRTSSYGNAEMHFLPEFYNLYGQWKRYKVNGAGESYKILESLVERKGRLEINID